MNNHIPLKTKFISMPAAMRLLVITLISTFAIAIQTAELPAVSAQAQPDNIIGIVINGTDGGEVPPNLEVLLMSIDIGSNQIIEQETTTVDEDGIFHFNNLISGPGLAYRVVVDSGDYTPSVDMANVENWNNVRITIYDETTSLDDITISSYVLMMPTIDARTRQAGILTVINVDNRGDRIWVPNIEDPNLTGFDLLRFNLPDGFTDLSIESALPTGNILQIDTGFAITNPIPPGEAAILISYIVPYEGDGFDFNLKMPYGIDQLRLLVPEGGGAISGEGFGSIESVVVAESVFNSVEGNDYAADTELLISFEEMPQPTFVQSLSEFFDGRGYIIVIIWVVGILLLVILGYALYSSRKNSNLTSDDDDEVASRADIIAEIAALDEEYEADKIDEDEYNVQRDELKSLALELDSEEIPDASDGPSKYVYEDESEESEK
jgi:uncharacterized membrane protein